MQIISQTDNEKMFGKNLCLSILFVATFISGCATTETTKPLVVKRQVVHFPSVGVVAEAEVGQTLISKANLQTFPAIVISTAISEAIKHPFVNNRWSGNIKIPPGKLTKIAESAEGSFYSSENGEFEGDATSVKYPVGVFVPNDRQKPSVMYVNSDNSAIVSSLLRGGILSSYIIDKSTSTSIYDYGKIPVDHSPSSTEVWGKDSFKSELVYGGLSQKTITISYREFVDGTARPAFSQEIKYDLNESDVIGFRGARFQILKASNTNIQYKVIKALD